MELSPIHMDSPLELYEVPSGWPGTAATLRLMRREIRAGQLCRGLHRLVDTWTRGIGRNPSAEIAVIYDGVRRFIVYRKGPVGMLQFVRGVEEIIRRRAGNCADSAVLLSAAFQYLGHPTRLVVTAARGRGADSMAHVWVEVWDRGRRRWISADPTFSKRLGAAIPRSRRGATRTVSWRANSMRIDGLDGLDAGAEQQLLATAEQAISATPYGGAYTAAKSILKSLEGRSKTRPIIRVGGRPPTPEQLARSIRALETFKQAPSIAARGPMYAVLRECGWKRFPGKFRGAEGAEFAVAKGLQAHIAKMNREQPGALDAALRKLAGTGAAAPGGAAAAITKAPAAAVAAVSGAAAKMGLPAWALPAGIAVAGVGVLGLLLAKRR